MESEDLFGHNVEHMIDFVIKESKDNSNRITSGAETNQQNIISNVATLNNGSNQQKVDADFDQSEDIHYYILHGSNNLFSQRTITKST